MKHRVLFLVSVLLALAVPGPVEAQESPMIELTVSASEVLGELQEDLRQEIETDIQLNGITEHQLRNTFFTTLGPEDIRITDASGTLQPNHMVFLGGRLGVPFLFGLVGTYMYQEEGKIRFHFDVEGSITLFIAGLSAGAGFHPMGNGFYLGGRLHYLAVADWEWLDEQRDPLDNNIPAAGLEIGWTKKLGKTGGGLLTVRAGGFAVHTTQLRIFPDVALGLSLRLFKH